MSPRRSAICRRAERGMRSAATGSSGRWTCRSCRTAPTTNRRFHTIDWLQSSSSARRESLTHFPSAGLTVMRRGDDYLLVANGIVGTGGFGNHKHNDLLGFEYHVNGEAVIVDAGSFVYTSDPDARNLFRSTAYHNTLCIDGVEQNEFRADWLFRMFEKALPEHVVVREDADACEYRGRHHGYARLPDPIVHERTFLLSRSTGMLTIVDCLEGRGRHRLQWH